MNFSDPQEENLYISPKAHPFSTRMVIVFYCLGIHYSKFSLWILTSQDK